MPINCKIVRRNNTVAVLNNQGEQSELFSELSDKYGPELALDMLTIAFSEEGTQVLQDSFNTVGEPPINLVEELFDVYNETQLGEPQAEDVRNINVITSQANITDTNSLIETLDQIAQGEVPSNIEGISAEQAKELSAKIKNSEEVFIDELIPPNSVMTENGPRDNYDVLHNKLIGIESRSDFDNIILDNASPSFIEQYNSNPKFAEDFYNAYREKSVITQQDNTGEIIVQPNRLDESLESLNIDLSSSAVVLSNSLLRNTTELNINRLEEAMANVGVDFTGLQDALDTKGRPSLNNLLQSFVDLNVNPSPELVNTFSENYSNFFDVEVNPDLQISSTDNLSSQYTYNPNRVDQTQLFQEQNLVEVAENYYKQVEPLTTNQMVEDVVQEALYNDNTYLPNRAFTGKRSSDLEEGFSPSDYVATQDINTVKDNIKNYLESTGETIEQRNINYYKAKEQVEIDQSQNETSTAFLNILQGRDVNYLKDRFLTEFTNQKILQRLQNSSLYNNFYQFLSVTPQGLRLNDTSLDAIRRVVQSFKNLSEANQNILAQHLSLSGEKVLTSHLGIKENVHNETPETYTNRAVNNIESIKPYNKSIDRLQNNIIKTTFAGEQIIRIGKDVYEKINENGVESTYQLIPSSTDNYRNMIPVDRSIPAILIREKPVQTEGTNTITTKETTQLRKELEC